MPPVTSYQIETLDCRRRCTKQVNLLDKEITAPRRVCKLAQERKVLFQFLLPGSRTKRNPESRHLDKITHRSTVHRYQAVVVLPAAIETDSPVGAFEKLDILEGFASALAADIAYDTILFHWTRTPERSCAWPSAGSVANARSHCLMEISN